MAQNVDRIATERLFLRGIDETDAESIVLWRSDSEVYKYFKSPHKITVEEHKKWYVEKYLQDDNRFDWVCIEKDSGRKIGVFGLVKGDGVAEVNYLLAPEGQHKGYATEVLVALIKFASDAWYCNQIKAEIHVDNLVSSVLVKKLGFALKITSTPFCTYVMDLPRKKLQESL